ncbi:MAG: DUF4279 domain-containing protein [Thermoleophilaceae bacterium]|nr:DUF4279 domain-containing protein [Thermoleophilaceae bacterium]
MSVRGSRTASPPRPVEHAWEVRCDERGLTVDEQVDKIVARLSPYRPAIRKVVGEIVRSTQCLGSSATSAPGSLTARPAPAAGLAPASRGHGVLARHRSRDGLRRVRVTRFAAGDGGLGRAGSGVPRTGHHHGGHDREGSTDDSSRA